MYKSPSAVNSPNGSFVSTRPRFASLPGSPRHVQATQKEALFPDSQDFSPEHRKVRVTNNHKHAKAYREAGQRVQVYEVLPSDQVSLFHGLPFQKYGPGITQASDLQRLIVSNELKVLFDKARGLSMRLSTLNVDPALFELTEPRLQEAFNMLLEETIGLLTNVCVLFAPSYDECLLPPRTLVESESMALQRNVEELGRTCEVLKKQLERRSLKHVSTLDGESMSLFLQFVARARFNIAELSEECVLQDTHRRQQATRLSEMAQMSTLQHFLPTEVRRILNEPRRLCEAPRVRAEVCAGYKSGSLQRNMGLAVLHSLRQRETGAQQPQSEKVRFISRLMEKFCQSKHRRAASLESLSQSKNTHPLTQKVIEDEHFYRNVSHLYLSNDVAKLARQNVARPRPRFKQPEVIKALRVGLRASPDERRFLAIKELMEKHERGGKTSFS